METLKGALNNNTARLRKEMVYIAVFAEDGNHIIKSF